ncbi:small multidrug resistance pump [Rhodoligotrophos appendicifer]|uniref:DMT family transporter n=1 Tax=Rhodoligotrophos appendicifer TaxID=987056 RepID=UPI001185C49F|nr:SMR family transporter [Rhodoligotrophos appendicifer]
MPVYLWMVGAVVFEVIGTSALQASHQMTRLAPSLLTVAGYAAAFYCLSHALTTLPVGIAYAIWSGLGIVLISAVGYFLLGQRIDLPGLIGIGFILVGVVIVNIFSTAGLHS